MKKLFFLLISSLLAISCNDGDLIVTNFDFEDSNLRQCGTQQKVIFNLNNDGINEAIAFVFKPNNDSLFLKLYKEPIEIPLNDQNRIVYRTFSAKVGAEYFCNEIPPTSPTVLEQYSSTSGGTVIIRSSLNNEGDHDGDGILSEDEGLATLLDTDGDGIPDYLDIDDDGDNIPTADELYIGTDSEATGFTDTDKDGVPNYLDPDDDGDGVLTRNEDWNKDTNPTNDLNDEGLAHYLNPDASTEFIVLESIKNTFSQSYQYQFTVSNLTLRREGETGEQIRLEDYLLGYLDSPMVSITLTGDDDGEDGDEEAAPEE